MSWGRGAALLAAAVVLTAAMPDGTHADGIPAAELRSGFDTMTPEIQAMQRDDSANPGMLWVRDGETLWNAAPSSARPACAGCHGGAASSMPGVALRYPAFEQALGRPLDLAGQINQCRQSRQELPPLRAESPELLALTAYVGLQSRGHALTRNTDPRLTSFRERGRALFTQRMGQLNFACSQCHDDNWGQRLGGSLIPQGHPNGYPLYRIEWQSLGSLQRRLRNCLVGVRAEPYGYGAPELIDLELYLQDRAVGLKVETPAVRP